MRITLGITVIIQGAAYFYDQSDPAVSIVIIALLAIAVGSLLIIGLMTPFAAFTVFLISVGTAMTIIPSINLYSPATYLPTIYIIVISVAVVMLGPGAFSLDARMFGRREIIIPDKKASPKS